MTGTSSGPTLFKGPNAILFEPMVFIITTLPNPTDRLGVGLVVKEVLAVGDVVVVFDALNADVMVFLPADSFVGVLCACL